MTVRSELERAIAIAEASKGNYLLFAANSEDDKAKQVFKDMAEDMERHVKILESRQDFLNKYNQLNALGQGDDGDQKQAGGGQDKQGGRAKQQEGSK